MQLEGREHGQRIEQAFHRAGFRDLRTRDGAQDNALDFLRAEGNDDQIARTRYSPSHRADGNGIPIWRKEPGELFRGRSSCGGVTPDGRRAVSDDGGFVSGHIAGVGIGERGDEIGAESPWRPIKRRRWPRARRRRRLPHPRRGSPPRDRTRRSAASSPNPIPARSNPDRNARGRCSRPAAPSFRPALRPAPIRAPGRWIHADRGSSPAANGIRRARAGERAARFPANARGRCEAETARRPDRFSSAALSARTASVSTGMVPSGV